VNAFRIVLPLGVVAIIAGLIIGNTNISLVSSQGIDCGSAFGGGSGTLDADVQAACAPLLSEREMWATIFMVLSVGLLISAVFLYRTSQPSPMARRRGPCHHLPE
jgi:sugar phosphate permease